MLRPAAAAAALVLLGSGLTACTTSTEPGPDPGPVTSSSTAGAPSSQHTGTAQDQAPINTGPTTAAAAKNCPLLDEGAAHDTSGMRLGRVVVLRSGGQVVGCRIYATTDPYFVNEENLPPKTQPAIEVTTKRFRSSDAARNDFIRTAERGTLYQQVKIGPTTGLCFETNFYRPDRGKDWACTWQVGTTSVLLRTVITGTAQTALLVARRVTA